MMARSNKRAIQLEKAKNQKKILQRKHLLRNNNQNQNRSQNKSKNKKQLLLKRIIRMGQIKKIMMEISS